MSAPRLQTLRQVLNRVHLRVTLFAVGMAGLTVLLAGYATVSSYAQQNLALIARTASYSAGPALVFNDAEAARAALRPLADTPGVAGIQIDYADGRAFLTMGDAEGSAGIADLFAPRSVREPIDHDGTAIGTVRIFGNAQAIGNYIWVGIRGALLCLLLTGIAAWLLARRLQARIIEELRGIAGVAHAVRIDRAFGTRAPPASITEIASLSDDFNALLDELEAQHKNLRNENATLSHLVAHDPLTGLFNHAAFAQKLDTVIAEAHQHGESFAVLYFDCDRFKDVNDKYGHQAGDAVLRGVAATLATALAPGDCAGRLGGDEFAAILLPPSNAAEAKRIAQAVEAACSQPLTLPTGEKFVATISCGQAIFPDDGDDPATLLRKADKSMYRVKAMRQEASLLVNEENGRVA